VVTMKDRDIEKRRIFWRGDRIEWILARGFHAWFFNEIKEDRVAWPGPALPAPMKLDSIGPYPTCHLRWLNVRFLGMTIVMRNLRLGPKRTCSLSPGIVVSYASRIGLRSNLQDPAARRTPPGAGTADAMDGWITFARSCTTGVEATSSERQRESFDTPV